MRASLAEAYSRSAAAWDAGPSLLYDRLATVAVDRCPTPLGGAMVLDLGAGTGAASRAASARGAEVIALDVAVGMLAHRAHERPAAVAGDALALPFAGRSFDAVLACFSLNHLADPAAALVEARRVIRPGGGLLVTAYAEDDSHPVKEAVDAAAKARGWEHDEWYRAVRGEALSKLASVERALAVTHACGLAHVDAEVVTVAFPDLGPAELVAWRLGMAQLAPFVATLPPQERSSLAADAVARLGENATPLARSMVVLTARSA